MNQPEVLQILSKVGAVITDNHIVYTSGKHGTAYINKDALYPHTKETSRLCLAIAEQFDEFYKDDMEVEIVIAPAVGGVILSQWTAYHLTKLTGREVLGVYADKIKVNGEDDFVIKRGYDKLISGKNVLITEDLLTTGGSVRKVVAAVRAIGGNVVGVGVICNRGDVTPADLGDVPKLFALTKVKMDAWDEEACTLCLDGVPINTDVGHGREFLAKQTREFLERQNKK